jgi:hypothetical protein
MKNAITITGCLIIAALLMPLIMAVASTSHQVAKSGSLRSIKRALGLHAGILQVNAITDGIHKNGMVGYLLSDAAITTRHLLVTRGSDAAHFAVSSATTKPLGICQDEPPAAETPANIAVLGATNGTIIGVGVEAIAADAEVYAAAGGKLQDEPTAAGAYWLVGRALTACTGDGDQFAFTPCIPTRVNIIANAADLAALKTATAGVGLVKFLQA